MLTRKNEVLKPFLHLKTLVREEEYNINTILQEYIKLNKWSHTLWKSKKKAHRSLVKNTKKNIMLFGIS